MNDVYIEPNKGSYNDPSIAGGGQIYCQVSHVLCINILQGTFTSSKKHMCVNMLIYSQHKKKKYTGTYPLTQV